MASSIVLTIKSDETQAINQQILQLSSNKNREMGLACSRLLKDMASQRHRAIIDIQTGSAAPVAASGTLTLVSVIATDVCVIGPVTLTATSGGAGADEWDIDGGTDTLDADELVTSINGHATLSQVVSASNVAGVVTITALQKGVVGNFINISSVDSTITASAANLASGTGGVTEASVQVNLGIS